MTVHGPFLLIPVENQVRELDARLLLICVAVRQGFVCVIGPKRELEFRIASFPRSIYIAKSFRIGNRKFMPISRQLGHEIVAWDEEALVHLPPDIYFSRRLSARGMKYIAHLFAWGRDNAELWRQYPYLSADTPIHVTGNPRNDLLRPEIRLYFEEDARRIRRRYGDFILINTNFNHVNAFYPGQNLFQPAAAGETPIPGQAARGMPRNYAEILRDHKQALFEHFLKLIPALEAAFPELEIVVRPHPTENQDIYHRTAADCRRVRVTNEGNVVPWLMAARALVHNGCTTGVEAYAMRVPAVAYRPVTDDTIDNGFYRLPNRLSHQCFDFDELKRILEQILAGEMAAAEGEDRETTKNFYLAGLEGDLACERIVAVLGKAAEALTRSPRPGTGNRLAGWLKTTKRRVWQRYKAILPGSMKSREFERHRYPPIAPREVRERLARFQRLLGDNTDMQLEPIFRHLLKIGPSTDA
jgi:surface carbohydrate biosynthesis protein